MARVMTAGTKVHHSGADTGEHDVAAKSRGGSMNVSFMMAKNVLFWGSVSLSIYGLYAVVNVL